MCFACACCVLVSEICTRAFILNVAYKLTAFFYEVRKRFLIVTENVDVRSVATHNSICLYLCNQVSYKFYVMLLVVFSTKDSVHHMESSISSHFLKVLLSKYTRKFVLVYHFTNYGNRILVSRVASGHGHLGRCI